MHSYVVTYADSATVGMRNRQEIIEAKTETEAYAAAKLRMREGEFIRGVQECEQIIEYETE